MMSPVLRSTMCGSTAWMERKAALMLRFSMRSQASGSPFRILAANIGAGIGVKDVELTRPFEDLGHHARYTAGSVTSILKGNGLGAEFGAGGVQRSLVAIDQHDARAFG